MTGTQQKAFETDDQKVHFWQTLGTLLGWSHLRLLFSMSAHIVQGRIGIAKHHKAGRQQLDFLFELLIIDAFEHFGRHETAAHTAWFDSQQDRCFASSTSPTFAGKLIADESIIDFNRAAQQMNLVTLARGFSQFAQFQLCAALGCPDHVGQTPRREAAFVGAHRIDGGEPLRQWQLGIFKQGAGGN